MYKVIIVEDEFTEAQKLQTFLTHFGQENGVVFESKVYDSALIFLADYKKSVDIVFMDIELPDVNGMEISRRLRKQDGEVMIIFVTNMAQFAVQGYEVAAQDFIVKPVQYGEFVLKLKKALNRLAGKANQYVVLPCNGMVRRISVNELYYVEVIEHLVTYHVENGEIELTGSLKSAEQLLEGKGFMRCNNCYLVNLRFVREIRDSDAVLANGEVLRISRNKRKAFLKALADFYGGS